MKKIISFLTPILLAIIFVISINYILDKKINELSSKKDFSKLASKYGDFNKDSSSLIKEILAQRGDLFLFGSSEMKINVPQNSVKFFPIQGAKYNVSSFGRGYVQNLQQATMLGSMNLKQDQKIAYILSLQWFDDKKGVTADNFAVNFSASEFHNFLDNPKIREKSKKYYCNRVYELLSKTNKYKIETLYAKIYKSEFIYDKLLGIIIEPFYRLNAYMQKLKEKVIVYKELDKLEDKSDENLNARTIIWDDESKKIEEENKKIISTNEFRISDKFYENNIKKYLNYLNGRLKNQDATISKECSDFKFFLDVCDDLDIKPYVIMQPVNGWYYDYLGFGQEKRSDYYNMINSLCKEKNIDVLDLREYEYKKNFLMDVMHLGKEGWLKVDQGIYNHFKQR